MLYLVDTGCNTNLISKRVFDRLPKHVQDQLMSCDTHGQMADGTKLPFYGVVQVPIKVRDVKLEEIFVVSQISEDAILGMPFLANHDCRMDFTKPVVTIGERELVCTDRYGRLMASRVQTVKKITIPPRTEVALSCRLTSHNHAPEGIIESLNDKVVLANSVNRPGVKGAVIVRCLNPTSQPLELPAGTTIGTFTSIDQQDISENESSQAGAARCTGETWEIPEHIEAMFKQACKGCATKEQEGQLAELLSRYQTVFSKDDQDVGRTELVYHSIPTAEGTRPIRQPPHRLGPQKEQEAERQVQDLLSRGMIEPANGAWSSPVVLVRKKDQSWRFCVDYRKLNAVTLQDAYPLPRIDESLDALSGSKYFSTLDLTSGYWQVPLDQDAQDKSAFTTRSGLWKWKVLPFGLTSAPATFQRLMEQVLHGLHWKTLLLYLDDVIVISPDFESHIQRLQDVFERLQDAGLKLKPSKCELLQDEVHYLGHVVSADGVATDPDKVAAIHKWEAPKDVKTLQAFLGTAGYYRQYLPDFATVAKPLTRLISGDNSWIWGTEEQTAFQRLKDDLVSAPVLGYPDPKLPYILDTDASAVGVGAVLSQVQEGKERVIAYYSKTLAPPERNYCVTRRELLAVVKAMKHFRPYLYGTKFKLRTDHASLRWLCRRHEPSAQVARWLEIMSAFSYDLEHRAGKLHGNADGLSRQTACLDCKQCAAIEQRDGGPSRAEIEAELQATDQVVKVQAQDPVAKDQSTGGHAVARIYASVQTGEPLTAEELQLGGTELKRLYARKDALRIRPDGVMEIRLIINQKVRWCVVCPYAIRKTVIWETHGLAHAGMNRTVARLQLTWYWPGMVADVRRILKTCEVCQVAKPGGNKPPGSRQRLYAGRPWQKVAIDLVGPLPRTKQGNQWILVLTDHFTRWQDALPLPDATAPTVATTLDERVFCYFGLPEQIHSDLGKQFQSQLMMELCALWQVDQTHTTPYHPQANGVVERGNRVLGDALRALLLERSQEDWDLVLPQLLRAFRGTPQSGTGETANLLMLGRELRLPDLLMNNPPPVEYQAQAEYTQDLIERLEETHELLRQQQMDVRQEDSEEPPLFQSGDLVLMQNVRRRKGEAPKLQPKFVGPYEVVEAYRNHTYLLERLGQATVQNECRLKLYRPCIEKAGQAPGMLENTGCKTSVNSKKKKQVPVAKHREQAARRPVQNDEEDYFPPQMTLKERRIQYGLEIETNIPDNERQMDEVAANLPLEQLPVATDENETATPIENENNELNNEEREDNSLCKEETETVELPAPVTTRSGRVSKPPAKLRDYVCSEVINKVTQEPNLHSDFRWAPTHISGKLLPLAAALGFQQRRENSSLVPGSLNKTVMDIEAI